MLRQPVVAYLAATHPDHGVPVYQEVEYWLTTGCTLGEAMKHTYDAVVLANGGRPLDFPVLRDGQPLPNWGPTEIMLYGTASRVLFGDPRLQPCDPVHEPPLLELSGPEISEGSYPVTLTVTHPEVGYSLMDTFHCDMAAEANGFNDRVYVRVPLDSPAQVEAVTANVSPGGPTVDARVVGVAFEEGPLAKGLHVQVDLPSTGYQQGPIRREGATVTLTLRPAANGPGPERPRQE
jgi:hypothetical protein